MWYPGWVTLEPPPHGQRLSFQSTATPLAEDTARVHAPPSQGRLTVFQVEVPLGG